MKILVLSTEYPNPLTKFDTPVVHYYVRQWLIMGVDVKVIHLRSKFPLIYYLFARLALPVVKRIVKTDFVPTVFANRILRFKHEMVDVVSLPLKKYFPHTNFKERVVLKAVGQIKHECERNDFIPDFILGHFVSPQLQIIPVLKRVMGVENASLVLHEPLDSILAMYQNNAQKLFNSIDYIGFRFPEMQRVFENKIAIAGKAFICPSGVPSKYILEENFKVRKEVSVKICFVGMLIPLKNVDVLINAVSNKPFRKPFELFIAGEGLSQESLVTQVNDLGISDSVKFLGRMSREDVQKLMHSCELFVMVSKPEAFGLVYLEAMAKGCLVVGSKGQGIDGVIVHGVNGFLCEPGNVKELFELLGYIDRLDAKKRDEIVQNALRTARDYSDEKVAQKYLKNLGINYA
mgnify:CR=1 FL=1